MNNVVTSLNFVNESLPESLVRVYKHRWYSAVLCRPKLLA